MEPLELVLKSQKTVGMWCRDIDLDAEKEMVDVHLSPQLLAVVADRKALDLGLSRFGPWPSGRSVR